MKDMFEIADLIANDYNCLEDKMNTYKVLIHGDPSIKK